MFPAVVYHVGCRTHGAAFLMPRPGTPTIVRGPLAVIRLAASPGSPGPADGPALARLILGLSAVWTAAVWATRIDLLADSASTWARWRIAISLGFAVILLVLWWRPHETQSRLAVFGMAAYGAWMIVVWAPSLVVTLASDASAAFQLVHTVLAVVSLASGATVAGLARRAAFYPPTITSSSTAANSTAR